LALGNFYETKSIYTHLGPWTPVDCRVTKGCMSNLGMGVIFAHSSTGIPQHFNLFVSQIIWTFSPQEPCG